jgi:nitrite reductase/ring-hydroxylating ferredoxin subunit
MSCSSPDAPVLIARVDDVAPGCTRKFILHCGGADIEGFVLNYGGRFYAYVNRCCHIPMTMDWVENQFFTDDGAYVQCATHGALYEPTTGECVAGPPLGRCLIVVPLLIRGGEILATCPAA